MPTRNRLSRFGYGGNVISNCAKRVLFRQKNFDLNRNPIEIREASLVDIPAIFFIRTGSRENAMTEEELRKSGITPESISTLLQTSGKCWVAVADDRLIGFCAANCSSKSIWALFILPAYEGRGIGRRLLKIAVNWLWKNGVEEIWLTTETKTRAEGFYEHLGWKRGQIEWNDGCEEVRYTLKR